MHGELNFIQMYLNELLRGPKIYFLYLNGERAHFAVFLEHLRGPKAPTKYYCRIIIVNISNSDAKLQREYSSLFAETDSWGWNKASLLETLFNGNYLDKDGGHCIFFPSKRKVITKLTKIIINK